MVLWLDETEKRCTPVAPVQQSCAMVCEATVVRQPMRGLTGLISIVCACVWTVVLFRALLVSQCGLGGECLGLEAVDDREWQFMCALMLVSWRVANWRGQFLCAAGVR